MTHHVKPFTRMIILFCMFSMLQCCICVLPFQVRVQQPGAPIAQEAQAAQAVEGVFEAESPAQLPEIAIDVETNRFKLEQRTLPELMERFARGLTEFLQ